MQIGRLHVASRHVVRQSFLCTPIFASKIKLKQKGLNWDLNLGPLEPYAKSVGNKEKSINLCNIKIRWVVSVGGI